MALRDDIRNAMIEAGFNPDDETSATSPKYNARLFEAIAGVVSAGMAGSVDWSTLTEYETAGTRSVTVPQGCDKMIVFEACGAGGGGGNASKESGSYWWQAGAGGNAGEFRKNFILNVIPGDEIRFIIGQGGAVSANGGSTVIGNITLRGGHGASNINPGQVYSNSNEDIGFIPAMVPASQSSSTGGNLLSRIGVKGANGGIGIGGYGAGAWYGGVKAGVGYRGGGGGGAWGGSSVDKGAAGGNGYACFAFIRKAA